MRNRSTIAIASTRPASTGIARLSTGRPATLSRSMASSAGGLASAGPAPGPGDGAAGLESPLAPARLGAAPLAAAPLGELLPDLLDRGRADVIHGQQLLLRAGGEFPDGVNPVAAQAVVRAEGEMQFLDRQGEIILGTDPGAGRRRAGRCRVLSGAVGT